MGRWFWAGAFVIYAVVLFWVAHLDYVHVNASPSPQPPFTSASSLFGFFGLGAVLLFAAIYTACSGYGNPLRLAMGEDGHLSTSKFQFLLWTIVFAYAYVMLEVARIFFKQDVGGIGYLPHNVLIAMGFSVTTAVGAHAIVVSYASNGKLNKPPGNPAGIGQAKVALSDLILNDDGEPDLSKVQMLLWTIVAAGIYLFQAHHGIGAFAACDATTAANNTNPCTFPDVDAALMVLMGLGQGAYLGGKIASVDTPRLVSITPSTGPGGANVTLNADDLGSDDGKILVNGVATWDPNGVSWSDKTVTLTIPATAPDGTPWSSGTVLKISAVTARQAPTNTVDYVIQLQR
jgi:hypothetical protein